MKQFLVSRAARRTAWLTLVALTVGLGAPMAQGRAAAETPARTAYLVPFTAAQGVDAEIPTRMTAELTSVVRKFRGDARVKQPIELLALSERDPVVARALADGAITKDQVATPPTDKDAAVKFARALGLTTVLVGSVDSYKEAADHTTASIDVTVLEYYVPSQADAEANVVRTASKNTQVKAGDEREKALLRSSIVQRVSLMLAAALMDAPTIVPAETTSEPGKPAAKKGGGNGSLIWIVVGVIAGVAAIFLISTAGNSHKGGSTTGAVTGVQAFSLANGVRVEWSAASGAVGYNVYRRASGTQTIRSRGRSGGRASDYTLLVNPSTNTTPTTVGSQQTYFIDTTAANGTLYDYAVAAVDSNGGIGALSAPVQQGANIGVSPSNLLASAGNGFVHLSWDASSTFVNGYIIFRRSGGTPATSLNSPDELIRVGTVTSYDDKTVTNDVTYTYVVQPYTTVNVNGKLAGVDSNPATATPTASALPQAPQNVSATVDTSGNVLVSWSANPETNIDFYEIMQRRDRAGVRSVASGNAPWLRNTPGTRTINRASGRRNPRENRALDLANFQLIGTTPATTTTFQVTGLADGAYTFAVRAVNKSGQRGDASASSSVTVTRPAAAPSNVTAVGLDKSARITWQAVQSVGSYNVYRSQSPITSAMTNVGTAPGITLAGSVSSSATTYTDVGLPNNVTFYYAVTSVSTSGAESDFGKGSTPDTGVVAIPHSAPATMTIAVDNNKTNLSGNGFDTAVVRVTVKDAGGGVVGGVQVNLTTTPEGSFTNLPANASKLDSAGRQVQALTDLSGQVVISLLSSVVATTTSVSVQAQAAELPSAQQLASLTFAFQQSVPVVMVVTSDSGQLPADGASTTNLTARVLDALGNPVPDTTAGGGQAYNVTFAMNSTNGSLRRAGSILLYPFPDTPVPVDVPVINGQAVAVYRAGTDSATTGTPPKNIITIAANVKELPSVASQTLVSLVPGPATRVDFQEAGTSITQTTVTAGQTKTITVIVRDARGNPVRAGAVVNFTVNPVGPFTVPASGTTDDNGAIQLQITGGTNTGGAVLIGTIGGTSLQSQLAVTVQ